MGKGEQNQAPIVQMLQGRDVTALVSDPQVKAELTRLGDEIMASERPRTSLPRKRTGWRPAAVVAAAALGLGGTAIAAAASGLGLFSGYTGDDELVDTTSWQTAWASRIDTHTWPAGFDRKVFIDGQAADGMARPDAVPAQDLDYEVLALNSCSWVVAYRERQGRGDVVGQEAAVGELGRALRLPANRALEGEALPSSIEAMIEDAELSEAEVRSFSAATCDHGLLRSAIKNAR